MQRIVRPRMSEPDRPSRYLSGHLSVAMESIERRLDARLFALVVFPVHRDLVTRLRAAYPKIHERIFRHGLAPLRVHHGLAIVRGDHAPNEMQRYDFAGNGILAQTGLHRVEHQHLYVGYIALELGADLHWVSHLYDFPSIPVRFNHHSRQWSPSPPGW